jgi:hypothetical protein
VLETVRAALLAKYSAPADFSAGLMGFFRTKALPREDEPRPALVALRLLLRPMLPAAPEESAVITRRECVIGLVVVALCFLGFFVFRPTFADASNASLIAV